MRETTRSLSAYFVLTGGFSVIGCIVFLLGVSVGGIGSFFDQSILAILYTLSYVVSLVLGAAYFWVGIKLKHLLQTRPNVPIQLAAVSLGFSLIRLSIFAALLNAYIYHQLKRLAREADTELEEQILV